MSLIESLAECNLDLVCITETWLLPSDVTIIGVALPSYSFHHVPGSTDARGGEWGLFLIHFRALSNVRVVPKHMDVSSFEFLEITFSLHFQNIRMAILYHLEMCRLISIGIGISTSKNRPVFFSFVFTDSLPILHQNFWWLNWARQHTLCYCIFILYLWSG